MAYNQTYVAIGDLDRVRADMGKLVDTLRGVLRDTDIASDKTEQFLKGEGADKEDVQRFIDKAWETSKASREALRAMNTADTVRLLSAYSLNMKELVNACREMMQADSDTLQGRAGCEKRWDAAMKALRTATQNFRG